MIKNIILASNAKLQSIIRHQINKIIGPSEKTLFQNPLIRSSGSSILKKIQFLNICTQSQSGISTPSPPKASIYVQLLQNILKVWAMNTLRMDSISTVTTTKQLSLRILQEYQQKDSSNKASWLKGNCYAEPVLSPIQITEAKTLRKKNSTQWSKSRVGIKTPRKSLIRFWKTLFCPKNNWRTSMFKNKLIFLKSGF